MSPRIAIMRHGHTAWNREHRIQGRTDIPLDDEARDSLRALALPEPWDAADLWASPLSRAIETAELISRAPQISPELTEMDWGAWEGLHGAELLGQANSGFRDIEDWGWDYCPPDGESPRSVLQRVRPWLEARTNDTVAIGHIGVMRAVLAMAYDWDFHGPCPFGIKRNRLFVIEKSAGSWRAKPDPIRLIAKPA